MDSGAGDGLFDEALVERVELPVEDVVEAGAGVNKRFRPFDPDAVMLVPPSLDDWLPQDHLARFIADIVATELDLSRFYASYGKKKGQPPYDPRLMLRVVLYGYCVGVRSSRELERACVDVVAFRWLAGQQGPDFRSIARFRKRHLAALGNVFLQALELCRAAGMVSLGRVALDGTKVRANASRRKAMSYSRLTEKQKVLADEVSDLLAEADRIDAGEDARFGADKRGDELPAELARRESRLVKLRQAREGLEAEAEARAAAEEAAQLRAEPSVTIPVTAGVEPVAAGSDGAEDDVRLDAGTVESEAQQRPLIDDYAPPKACVNPRAQRNFTDPDSRIMKTADGSFHYCYNAQGIVDADHQVIVATVLNNVAVDVQQLIPMLDTFAATNGGALPKQFLADAGYCSKSNLAHTAGIEVDTGGATEFFIATGRHKHDQQPETVHGPAPESADSRQKMKHRLRTEQGQDVYRCRKAIVEPVFGQIHTRQGKYLLLRGLEQAKHEWELIAGCHNLLKLFTNRLKTARLA